MAEFVSGGQQPADTLADHVACLWHFQIAQYLREAEHTHADHGKIDPVVDLGPAERQALVASHEITPDGREQHADEDHGDGLDQRAPRQNDREHQAEHHQGEVVGRVKQKREPGQWDGKPCDEDGRDRAGDE